MEDNSLPCGLGKTTAHLQYNSLVQTKALDISPQIHSTLSGCRWFRTIVSWGRCVSVKWGTRADMCLAYVQIQHEGPCASLRSCSFPDGTSKHFNFRWRLAFFLYPEFERIFHLRNRCISKQLCDLHAHPVLCWNVWLMTLLHAILCCTLTHSIKIKKTQWREKALFNIVKHNQYTVPCLS